jgi:hypothetical protein
MLCPDRLLSLTWHTAARCAPASQGFGDVRVASSKPIPTGGVDSPLARKLGAARFFSITYRLFKLREGRLESSQEDYGHVAIYKGTMEGAEAAYSLDASHRFEKARRTAMPDARTPASEQHR